MRSPKGPDPRTGQALLDWAREQVEIAARIVDNPGGGLLFATQTMGQVRARLGAEDAGRFAGFSDLLRRAELAAIRRDFGAARDLLTQAGRRLNDPAA